MDVQRTDVARQKKRKRTLLIGVALDKSGGNVSLAAEDLGLSRSALYRRLEKHGLN